MKVQMTEPEFRKAYSKLRRYFFVQDGILRTQIPSGKVVCPLTALYWSKTGEFLAPSLFDVAAKRLGIGAKLRNAIVAAADGCDTARDLKLYPTLYKFLHRGVPPVNKEYVSAGPVLH